MIILHINKFFDLRGGAEAYMHGCMKRQAAAGHEVHAFSTRSLQNVNSPDAPYFVERFNFDRYEGFKKDAVKPMHFIWNREAARSLERQISEVKPDVIHLHNIYHHLSSSILSVIRRANVPCVMTLHDYKLACPNYKMYTQGSVCERCKGGKYYQCIVHQCLFRGYAPNMLAAFEMGMTKAMRSYERTVRAFLCPSQFMKHKMESWGEPPGKLHYLPNPTDAPEHLLSSRGSGTYVYIGRLYPEKGVEFAVRAAARVPSVQLEIVGEGPERARLEQLAQSLAPGRIRFLGFQSGDALREKRGQAKAILAPSVWYENGPLTILEAMADGVPVMGSAIGGIPELIQDGVNGFLVEPGNVDGWIDAFKQMEQFSLDQRLTMGDAGRAQILERFTWKQHLAELDKFYSN